MKLLNNSGGIAAECSHAQFLAFARFAVHAAELMQQPRRHDGMELPLIYEPDFVAEFRTVVAEAAYIGLGPRVDQLLADAWRRLQLSGVLQSRHIDLRIEMIAPEHRKHTATLENSLTAAGLRRCALPGCGAKEAHPAHFKSCAACRTVVYCCREHQVAGWPAHKKACKAARKAAEAEDEARPSGA